MLNDLAVFGFASPVPALDATPAPPSGICCPFCKSASIRSDGPLEIDRYAAARYLRCNGCRNEWTDVYELAAYPA